MRVVYMGKNKPAVIEGLTYLIEKGIEVVVVVAPPKDQPLLVGGRRLCDTAHDFGIPTATDEELYNCFRRNGGASEYGYVLEDIDLVISFLFWKRIKKPLIDLPKIGCINFHPSPLPEFRGVGGTNFAIYENLPSWEVSVHFVDENFDTGDIIKIRRFAINPQEETAFSLDQKTQGFLLDLFREIIDLAYDTGSLPRTPQGEGCYFTRQDFEQLKRIRPDDTLEMVERKIRAFWYPPYGGALIEIQGEEFTLVNERLLKELGRMYHEKDGTRFTHPVFRAGSNVSASCVG